MLDMAARLVITAQGSVAAPCQGQVTQQGYGAEGLCSAYSFVCTLWICFISKHQHGNTPVPEDTASSRLGFADKSPYIQVPRGLSIFGIKWVISGSIHARAYEPENAM